MTATDAVPTRGRSVRISLIPGPTRRGRTLPPLDSAAPSTSDRAGALWRPAEYRSPLWTWSQPVAVFLVMSFRGLLSVDLAARSLRSRSRSADAAPTDLGPMSEPWGVAFAVLTTRWVRHLPRPPLPYLQPRPALVPACRASASRVLVLNGQWRSVVGAKTHASGTGLDHPGSGSSSVHGAVIRVFLGSLWLVRCYCSPPHGVKPAGKAFNSGSFGRTPAPGAGTPSSRRRAGAGSGCYGLRCAPVSRQPGGASKPDQETQSLRPRLPAV